MKRNEEINTDQNQDNKSNDTITEHIVLLGDSILDNGSYVTAWDHSPMFDAEGSDNSQTCDDVLQQLKSKIIRLNWHATNCAVDGAITEDVIKEQLITIPDTVTTIVLSAGGNDGLESLS